jgi:hypothetical protein
VRLYDWIVDEDMLAGANGFGKDNVEYDRWTVFGGKKIFILN